MIFSIQWMQDLQFFRFNVFKIFLKKPLVLSWWDYVGKEVFLNKNLEIFSKTFGVILQKMDTILRKSADANLVVNEDVQKVNKINKIQLIKSLGLDLITQHTLFKKKTN